VLKVQIKEGSFQHSIEKLWELDHVPESSLISADDMRELEHFHDIHDGQSDGRYAVKLQRPPNFPVLGNSKAMALKRFYQKELFLK